MPETNTQHYHLITGFKSSKLLGPGLMPRSLGASQFTRALKTRLHVVRFRVKLVVSLEINDFLLS
jgi:hypothetical protein